MQADIPMVHMRGPYWNQPWSKRHCLGYNLHACGKNTAQLLLGTLFNLLRPEQNGRYFCGWLNQMLCRETKYSFIFMQISLNFVSKDPWLGTKQASFNWMNTEFEHSDQTSVKFESKYKEFLWIKCIWNVVCYKWRAFCIQFIHCPGGCST